MTPAALSLHYSRDAHEHALDESRDLIADEYEEAWLAGRWAERITGADKHQRLIELISESLSDTPGNPLSDVVELVREQANAGNAKALQIIRRMAFEHGQWAVELADV